MNVEQVLIEQNKKFLIQGNDFLITCTNPDHDDAHPSMRIDRVTGVFQCFSCGHKGNIFKEFGYVRNKVDKKTEELKMKINKTLQDVKLTIPLDAKPFEKEFRGINSEVYTYYEAFTSDMLYGMEDRLIFPIRNVVGDIKIFIGRDLFSDGKKKYKFYPAGISPPLFPAIPRPYKSSVFLVEGIFDALNLIDKGILNVICCFGTNTITESTFSRLGYLNLMGANKFYILFDGDEAGYKAGAKLEKLINSKGLWSQQITLPEGLDPGQFTKDQAEELKETVYENSIS
jgi:DNA primase